MKKENPVIKESPGFQFVRIHEFLMMNLAIMLKHRKREPAPKSFFVQTSKGCLYVHKHFANCTKKQQIVI